MTLSKKREAEIRNAVELSELYAPSGYGNTQACDDVEVLLGEIDRLRDLGKKDQTPQEELNEMVDSFTSPNGGLVR